MKQRIVSGVVAAAIFLPIVIYGKLPFLFLVFLLATIGLYELFRMKKLPVLSAISAVSFLLLWLILLPEPFSDFLDEADYSKTHVLFWGILLMLIFSVVSKNQFTFDDAGFVVLSVLYCGLGFYYFYETRQEGLIYVFFALFSIWATDSGAYFIGRSIGKRKLWPEISPNKTVEGFLGGILFSLIVGAIFFLFTSIDISAAKLFAMSVLIGIFGQMGDLVQSAYKRHYGVKDSGNLIPGHGGILDRMDSMIFILPLLHLLHLL
ncbi:phosphatidate cytidylyltransferase [Peribacillus saganii]|uniref:Phosphatidate cytidylyltransferase n=1 Tax=Peribacillus saganii TaxID=2303992 RepID=A0A372LU43_9BACI|nr:phosphatidate cytidylyltransferase [Peribacillus saganii]RFU71320.1 phosphatidate cytidylyltransferase [Peribacillus saganii]